MSEKALLVILDGWGIAPDSKVNAFTQASTTHLDYLLAHYPYCQLACSGEAVGLPEGQQGNSEVGHLNLGAGRVVYQELLRIQRAIADGSFYQNEAFSELFKKVKEKNSALHLMGLVSDGGVHSHETHLFALLKLAKDFGLTKVYIHAFLDGRDVSPKSAEIYLEKLEAYIKDLGVGQVATLSGRYYAMDRDNRWERVSLAYEAIYSAKGEKYHDALEGLQASYAKDVTDEFVEPRIVGDYQGIGDNDGLVFFNFRADRARELTKAIILPDFDGFERKRKAEDLSMVTLTAYEAGLEKHLDIAYPPQRLDNTLGAYLSSLGKRQMRIAETEKYAHVTFFFNGGVEAPHDQEDRKLIPSPKVATYDLKPEMSAQEVADSVIEAMEEDYDFILVNFANPDMVGHTGKLEAAKVAMQAVDEAIGRIYAHLDLDKRSLLICADHGNCEKMADEEGRPFTSHTSNPVYLVGVSENIKQLSDGALCDVAPTILALLQLEQPVEMTGKSLLN